jgi:hypothetical protein
VSDPAALALVRKALTDGLGGCVEWDIRVAERVDADLSQDGLTLLEVRRLLIEFVRAGGEVVQVAEVRENWINRRDYWYKVIVPIPGIFTKGLFVEMELFNTDPDVPEVRLVNAHEQR